MVYKNGQKIFGKEFDEQKRLKVLHTYKGPKEERLLYHMNGKVVAKQYYEDREGEGTWYMYDSAGVLQLTEEYERGKLEGKRTKYYPNKQPKRVEHWKGGSITGSVQEFSEEGVLVADYPYTRKGVLYGTVNHYHLNGKVAATGKQYGEKKLGEWKYFDKKGRLIKTEKWNKGELLAE